MTQRLHSRLRVLFAFVAITMATAVGGVSAQSSSRPTPPDPVEAGEEPRPWRVQDAIGDPSWLKISGQTRLRYEGIEGQFRASSRLAGSDHLFFQRTLLRADADLDPLGLTLEVLDSRHYGGGNGSSLSASNVNTLDLLQVFAEIDLGSLASGEHRVRVGRQTIDLGSRRLVARNRFRNTINAFTGVDWHWEGESAKAEAFWTMPVRRKPSDLESVVDNEIELDDQDVDRQFMGAFYRQELPERHVLEVYAYFLWEEDFLQRELVTPGVRLLKAPKRGEIDYEYEFIYQLGHSRILANFARELDHNAWFQHASMGYTFDTEWQPRVRAAFDYATGDPNRGDGDNNRFDPLFGARRFEYGPTGIYGPIARTNLLSPEVRLTLKPGPDVNLLFAWRGFWLARKQDAWVAAGVVDPTGQSGRHVGQQIETRARWDLLAGSVRLEAGAAYMFHGAFQADVPGGQNTDTTYAYVQATWKF